MQDVRSQRVSSADCTDGEDRQAGHDSLPGQRRHQDQAADQADAPGGLRPAPVLAAWVSALAFATA